MHRLMQPRAQGQCGDLLFFGDVATVNVFPLQLALLGGKVLLLPILESGLALVVFLANKIKWK